MTYRVATQIGLKLGRQNTKRRGFADTVGTYQTQHLIGTRGRKSVQFELIGTETMCGILLQVLGQVNDCNSVKWAALHANTTTNTQFFTDEGNLGTRADFDTQLACHVSFASVGKIHTCLDNGAAFLTFLLTFLRLASVCANYGHSGELLLLISHSTCG